MRQKASAFPIGLYGMLLLALCWLTVPRLFAPLERLLLGAVSLPARVVAEWSGTPALAASRDVLRERQAQADRLNERLHHFDAIGGRELMPADRVPQFCFVRSVDRRVAGGGVAGELRLDHTYRELAGCDELVTKGGALVGRLARLGVGPATDDGPDDFARVVLLNHAGAPPVYGGLSLADGEHLRFLVGPSAKVDPAPLRVDLWDNAYRAAKLDRGGQDVFTIEFSGGGVRQPAGLWLGQTRVWGYEALRTGEVLSSRPRCHTSSCGATALPTAAIPQEPSRHSATRRQATRRRCGSCPWRPVVATCWPAARASSTVRPWSATACSSAARAASPSASGWSRRSRTRATAGP